MLYLVFAFWAGATIAVMGGCDQAHRHVSASGCSADGGTVRLPAHPPLALGRVPVQVLRGSRLQLCALQFPVIRGTWQHGMVHSAAINTVILRSILKEAELDDKEVIKHIEPK